ncbi:lipase family protein [Nocardia sp. NPDC060249]|uniref:lipase family protein n=1 Tax=Nocardia sp. NPDC060249 TaxID=3347082 RepID=UPI00364C5E9E
MQKTLALTMIAAAVAFAMTAGPAGADPAMPSIPDSFYLPAEAPIAGQPGDIISTRPMPAPFAVTGAVTQLQFASTDTLGRAIPAVATVIRPDHAAPNGPVFVYGHTANALGLRCAPSQTLWSADSDLVIREAPALDPLLALGWTVIIPDHLGPRSAYGAARLGGQITLDSIRATQRHTPFNLAHSPITMAGYSGGGMAVAWAAALQPTYAPELSLTAAAIGGVPTNLETMAEALGHNPHPAFGLAAAAAFGLEREYGEQLPISEYLTDEGRRFRADMNNACTNEILRLGYNRSVGGLGTSFELFYSDRTREILRANSLEFFPDLPSVPILEWHSATDPLIPVASLDATMARWRAGGVSVTNIPCPAPEHVSGAALGLPVAVAALVSRVSALPISGGGR